jgi:mRNA-degrading endonuclease toxin of MazEF toxin-antitoxin module
MKINHYDIWLANQNPSKFTETGKTRPVAVIQNSQNE